MRQVKVAICIAALSLLGCSAKQSTQPDARARLADAPEQKSEISQQTAQRRTHGRYGSMHFLSKP